MALTLADSDFFFSSLNAMMLLEPRPSYVFDQFAFKEISYGSGGDTVYLNRYPYFGDVGLTLTARTLTESSTVGTANPVSQSATAVSVILKELSGPYNNSVSQVAPLGLSEKVARQAQAKLIDSEDPLSFFNSIGANSLKDDHDRFHDRVLCNLYLDTTNKRNPGGVADGSTATTSTGSTFSTTDLVSIRETLASNDAPPLDDGLFAAVISPRMDKHLKLDTNYRDAMRYIDPTRLMRGEIGVYEGFRFFLSNNIPTATVNSLTAYQGLFFGKQAVGYGEGNLPVQIRQSNDNDYDRFLYLIWLVYRGYALLDSRFCVKARTFAA